MPSRDGLIDGIICNAGELIGALLKAGPLTPEQIGLIVMAAVRARMPSALESEVRESVSRIVRDLEKPGARPTETL
jgi:hypothetical protein